MINGNPPEKVLLDPSMFDIQNIQKVLLIGSGELSIGQAGEFDYSGSQACKIHTYYESDFGQMEMEINDILERGQLGDVVEYYPNNQLGITFYRISQDVGRPRYLKSIGDYYGLFISDQESDDDDVASINSKDNAYDADDDDDDDDDADDDDDDDDD